MMMSNQQPMPRDENAYGRNAMRRRCRARKRAWFGVLLALPLVTGMRPAAQDLAWRLDGVNDYLDTGLTATHLGIMGNRPKTVEITLSMQAFQHHEGIFSMGRTEADRRDFSLRVNDGRINHFRGQFWAHDIDFTVDALNRWVQLSLVHDGRSQTLYADGEVVGRQTGVLATDAEGTLKIGFWHAENTGLLKALVSELRVWNRALPPAEILARSHRRLTGQEPGLVGYWTPDDDPDTGFVNRVDGRAGRLHGQPGRVPAPFRSDIRQRHVDMARQAAVTLGPVRLRHPVGAIRYQWHVDDRPIDGATDAVLALDPLTPAHAGVYHVTVADDRPGTPLTSSRVRLFDPGWPDGPFAETRVRYAIRLPAEANRPPASYAVVDVWPGGHALDTLQPVVIRADGRHCAAELLWGRSDEPVRIVFDPAPGDPPDDAADARRFFVFLGAAGEPLNPVPWDRRYSFVLETKHFDAAALQAFDPETPEAFVSHWNAAPELAGRRLVRRVQHGFPQHGGYGEPPLEYQAAMGAPLSLNRYRGYFTVEAAERARLEPLAAERETLREELEAIRQELAEHNRQLAAALAALEAAEAEGDPETVRNRRTAATEWRTRRDRLEKQTLPARQRRLVYVNAAMAEIRHNTHTFLTGSQGASWVLVDGRPVTHWPASETLPRRGEQYTGFREGAINLAPGTYRIDYLYAATGADYLAMLLWRRPAEEAAVVMEPADFTRVDEAVVEDALMAGGARPVAWRIRGDSRLPGVPDMLLAAFRLPGAEVPDTGGDALIYRWRFGDGGTGEGAQVEHLYLQSGRYPVTVAAYPHHGATEPLWELRQPVHIHVPYDLEHYLDADVMREHMLGKDLAAYPVGHVLTALRAVEQLDPERISYPVWRRRAIQALSARADELAALAADWAVRAGDIAMEPTVAHYDGTLALYRAAAAALPVGSPAWRRARIKTARAHVLAFGEGREALAILRSIDPSNTPPDAPHTGIAPRPPRDDDDGESRDWNSAWVEALMAAGYGDAAEAFVRAWRAFLDDPTPEQTIRQSARFRRIRSLIEQGGDTELLTAMELLDAMLREAPGQLVAPEFNIMMLDMYLGRDAWTTAYHQTGRLLALDLNPVHRAAVLARRVRALCGMRDGAAARREFEALEAAYPYSEGLRGARDALERLERESAP